MPSVRVGWSGKCLIKEKQAQLTSFLSRLAARSEARLNGTAPPRPAFLQMLVDQRTQAIPPVPTIRHFDEDIEGRVLLAPNVVADEAHLVAEAKRLGLSLVPVRPESDRLLLAVDRIRVRGIDFQLFDPRNLYPGEDRVSFVFLASEAAPFLEGCLAQVTGRELCRLYDSPAVNSADWYLSAPSIHLRYYLEEWSDYFLAWVKYFSIPDLRYWRTEDLPRYEEIRSEFENAGGTADLEIFQAAVFEYLLERFDREADEWITKVISWSA
jgi:hypothetical protein